MNAWKQIDSYIQLGVDGYLLYLEVYEQPDLAVTNIITNNGCDIMKRHPCTEASQDKNNPCLIVFVTHGPTLLYMSTCLLQTTLFKVDLIHILCQS